MIFLTSSFSTLFAHKDHKIISTILLLTVLTLPTNSLHSQQPDSTTNHLHLQLALTFDDLPWVGTLPPKDTTANQAVERIAAVLRVHQAPATGFVISRHAQRDETPLYTWKDWGFTLGNHTATHPDLNRISLDEWIAEVKSCDEYLSKFGEAKTPYLRFPMLHEGDSPEKFAQVDSVLQSLGLKKAPVTVDNSGWILAQVYNVAIQSKDAVLRNEVGQEFIRHITAAIAHADQVARRKAGRSVPQVLLLHANAMVADKLDALLLKLAARGVQFISLQEALSDSVYSRQNEYYGRKGLSWLYRMHPLSIEDVKWDDTEAGAIQVKFSKELSPTSNKVLNSPSSRRYISIISDEKFKPVFTEAAKSERMRSLLVMYQGQLVAEAYFNGAGPETAANLKSVTKSLTSALVGIALRKHWIESIDAPIGKYLTNLINKRSKQSTITIRQLLTMSSGLQPVAYGRIQRSANWVDTLLAQPVQDEYQGKFRYDTPVLQLLAAVLHQASGLSLSQLAQRELLSPLDAQIVYWREDSQGIELGGNDAYLRPRDLIKFGELYRKEGKFGNQQILPKTFAQASISEQIMPNQMMVNHSTLKVRGYGYLWWLLDIKGEPMYAALGHGGQILLVAPKRELVVLMTSRWPSISSTAHYLHLTNILVNMILPLFPQEISK